MFSLKMARAETRRCKFLKIKFINCVRLHFITLLNYCIKIQPGSLAKKYKQCVSSLCTKPNVQDAGNDTGRSL
jgi:hypothetical protein